MIELIIVLILTTYVVLNLSFFDPMTRTMEGFTIDEKIVYDITSGDGKWDQQPTVIGNHIRVNGQTYTGVLKTKMDSFTMMVKCSKNNDNVGIDGVFATQEENGSSILLKNGTNRILDILIPNGFGRIGIKEANDREWTFLSTQVLPIGDAVTYTFVYRTESAGNNVLEVFANENSIGFFNIQSAIVIDEGTVIMINESKMWKINLFEFKIFNGAFDATLIRKILYGSPPVIENKEYHKLMHENKIYDCLLKMRLTEPLMQERKVFEERTKCMNMVMCEKDEDSDGDIEKLKRVVEEKRKKYQNYTPEAFLFKGEYFVYVYIDSFTAKKVGYSGKRSYGKDRVYARNVFLANFPGVPIPSVFDDNYKTCVDSNNKECPFIIDRFNPCRQSECSGVDWNKRLPQACKDSVDFYCKRNANRDTACKCWNRKYSNTPECRSYRAKFGNPNITSCTVDIFNIEDHPNFKDYVRKDQIPCYGCNL